MTACRVQGCEKPAASAHLCSMHHQRVRRHGEVEREPDYRNTPIDDATAAEVVRRVRTLWQSPVRVARDLGISETSVKDILKRKAARP